MYGCIRRTKGDTCTVAILNAKQTICEPFIMSAQRNITSGVLKQTMYW